MHIRTSFAALHGCSLNPIRLATVYPEPASGRVDGAAAGKLITGLVFCLLLVTSVSCSSFVDTEGQVPCVPGCFNEDCPETFDFCAEAHGSCRPVPCKSNADCEGLDACDRGVTRSRRFVCDASGQCVRTPSPCPNNCGKGQPCPEPGQLCFTMANQCKYCDIHRCFRDSDCDNLRKANPGIEFECNEMKCVIK